MASGNDQTSFVGCVSWTPNSHRYLFELMYNIELEIVRLFVSQTVTR